MTAKEKAEELFKRHINYLCISDETAEFKSKESALITVDEIIKTIQPHLSTVWWQEVKEEIMKL